MAALEAELEAARARETLLVQSQAAMATANAMLSQENADLTAALADARRGPHAAAAAPAPGHLLSRVCEKWAETKNRLSSFKGDHGRAKRLLGIEPFVFGKEAVYWAPGEGPHADVKLCDRDAMTLAPEDIDMFRSWFFTRTTRRHGPPSVATVNRYVMTAKRMVNFAVSRRRLPYSPIEGYEDEDEDNARGVILEEEGFDLILTALGDNLLMRALVTLGYDSGMRRTELLYCRRSWLDERAGRVHIPAAIAKNGEARVTDYTPRAAAACKLLVANLKTDLLFPNPETGKPYDGRWVHEMFVRAVDVAGVVGRDGMKPRLHDLRRSFITLASRRGISDAVIMQKSGHKDHKVFRRYRIIGEKDLVESYATMEIGRERDLAQLREARRASPQRSPTSQPETGA